MVQRLVQDLNCDHIFPNQNRASVLSIGHLAGAGVPAQLDQLAQETADEHTGECIIVVYAENVDYPPT